jgi:putative oxidoreductase
LALAGLHVAGSLVEYLAMATAGLFLLRVTLAFVLVSHGGHILFGLGAGGGLGPGGIDQAAARFAAAGLEPGHLIAGIVGTLQFVGGLLIGFGLMSRWAAVAAIGLQVILIWKIQAQWGFYLNWTGDATRGHGIEFSIVLIGGLASLFLTGPGEWSLDGRRQHSAARRAAGRARLRNR